MLKKIISWFRQKKIVVTQKVADALQEPVVFCDPITREEIFSKSKDLTDFINKYEHESTFR